MGLYTLKDIAQITNGLLLGNGNTIIKQFATDSRKLIEPASSLFIAIVGERHDGHKYIDDLIQRGINNFLISRKTRSLENNKEINYILVENTISAFQNLAAFHRKRFNCPIIGITGSNGKTILKEWLSNALNNKINITRSPKSYNSQLGVPLSIMLLNDQTQTGIFEAGISQPGEMEKLANIIEPDQGIITNIGEAHQENFRSLEEKAREKLLLFKSCREIYFCADHELISNEINTSGNLEQISKYSWTLNEKDASTKFILDETGSKVSVKSDSLNLNFNFTLPFKDKAGIENTLHLANYLINNNFSEAEILSVVETIQPIAMRLELAHGNNNNIIINDTYNSDINSLNIALDYLSQQPTQEHVLVLSDIVQSGMPDNQLYAMVCDLCQRANLKLFIGVGKHLTANKSAFQELRTVFFSSTDQLLQSGLLNEIKNSAILVKGARKFNFENIAGVLAKKNHTTQLEINLSNLISNLNYYRSQLKPETGIMVMVKALAYGSGGNEVANLLQHEKVDYLGVAFTDEGVELRQSGINLPIMVMSPGLEDLQRIIENELEPEIYSFQILDDFISTVSKCQVSEYPVHIKIDTGMHRLGFMEEEVDRLLQVIKSTKAIKIKWCFSHLAASDSETHDNFTKQQIELFQKIHCKISDALGYTPSRHILNSAGIERFPQAHFDMVRLGIGLHGISAKNKNLLPVSSLKTHITQVKRIPKDETIGYNRHGLAKDDMLIGILPIGYADGLDRKFGNGNGQVIIQGNAFPFIGDICMDMSMVDLGASNYKEGQEAIIFGKENPITVLAEQIDTIPYEILTNISSRVKRVFFKD